MLSDFFRNMPPDSGLAFVVILHLSPTHQSILAELLGRETSMPVVPAEDGQRVEANHVYVIPPGKILSTVDGLLKLTELENERGKRATIDLFFRALGDTHGARSAAIVLSGADGDGAQGIRRIKERGGLTVVQDPREAEYPSMPRTAIDTGMVDWVLPIADVPAQLVKYFGHESQVQLPPEDGTLRIRQQPPLDESEKSLQEILVLLRRQTGRDFSGYKRATVLRRIRRRMQVNSAETLQEYLQCLSESQGEYGALLQDLLISVTNFFRDREAFDAVEALIPELFEGKGPSDTIRVWVPACATGEEAFSFAILLLEHARKLDKPPTLQVFACDLNQEAIQVARGGFYPSTISTDVSDERLKSFFLQENGGFRVRREVRETVLFAAHDLLKDPPFSRMDLVSCRNLLIYLDRMSQQQVLDTLHFSLLPGGLLFLGLSESIDEGGRLFEVIDAKHRIYRHDRSKRSPLLSLPHGGARAPLRSVPGDDPGKLRSQAASRSASEPAGSPLVSTFTQKEGVYADLHLRLLEMVGPPSVLINAAYDVVHLSEHCSKFLRFGSGEITVNILRVVDPALGGELRTALFRASETGLPAESRDIPIEIEGQPCVVNLKVVPAPTIAPGHMLVLFERGSDREPQSPNEADQDRATVEPVLAHLERELERVQRNLRETVEQHDAFSEELSARNEELQAMNEELRATTEELETGREELQSINEELNSTNVELRLKMDELGRANSDLQNLMSSTAIATVFLDRQLVIMRYTPSAAELFNLIPGDIGRPLAHLRHALDHSQLLSDAEQVLRTLVPIEREVRTADNWYLVRFQPYRTVEDQIAGVVLTLVNVTDRKNASESQKASEERLKALIESASDYAIFTFDQDRRIESWNSGAEQIFGYSPQEILGQQGDVLFTDEDRERGDPAMEARTALEVGRAANERWHVKKDGSLFYGSGSVMPFRAKRSGPPSFVKIMRDLTDKKRTQDALRDSEMRLRVGLSAARMGTWLWNIREDRQVLDESLAQLAGLPPGEAIESLDDFLNLIHTDDQATVSGAFMNACKKGESFSVEFRIPLQDGSVRWLRDQGDVLFDPDGEPEFLAGACIDITERKQAEEELRRLNAELDERVRQRTAELSHSEEKLRIAAQTAKDRASRLQVLTTKLARIQQEERRNLARTLHDHVQQMLVAAKMRVDLALSTLSDPETPERLWGAIEILDDSIKATRTLSVDLVPPLLHDQGLPAALEWLAHRMSEQHGVEIELDLDDANPEPDEHRDILFQAAQEFLLNAVKHSGDMSVILRLRRAGGQLWVTVQDKGSGFDPEARLSRQESFGLFNVRQRLEVAGGSLHINSQPGRGTTASATLPTSVTSTEDSDGSVQSTRQVARRTTESETVRVLIVDDHALVREGLRQILSNESGMEVVAEASNGVEGVALANLLQPDVVLMDVRMPEMNGIEATKQIRTQLANVQVIGLSLDEAEETSRSMIEAGAAMFLTKSAAGDRLVGAIRSVVRRPG